MNACPYYCPATLIILRTRVNLYVFIAILPPQYLISKYRQRCGLKKIANTIIGISSPG